MAKSLIDRLRGKAMPLICAGLFVLSGMKLADYLETPGNTTKQPAKPVDIYQSMSPQEAIAYVDTYDKARDYALNHLEYTDHKGIQSFEETHNSGKGVCRDAAQAVLSLLSDNTNSYDAFWMYLSPKDTNASSHTIALVKDIKTGKFGSIGINDTDCNKTEYRSVKEVYDTVNQSFSNKFSENSCQIARGSNTNLTVTLNYDLTKN